MRYGIQFQTWGLQARMALPNMFGIHPNLNVYYIENSKLCFHDMKIMSLRNGGDFGKQLVLRTRCLPNHHHSFVT